MSGSAERANRHSNRFRAGIHVEVEAGGQTIECAAENISRTGVLLVGPLPAPPTDRLEFTVNASTGNLKVPLSGRVVRVEPNPEGGLRVAVEFIDMDKPKHDALEALLARLLQTPVAGPFDHLNPGSPPQEIKKALETIPLPQRIALSSRAGPKEREVLRLDTQPAVLESLARNPSLTIAEARLLAGSAYLMPGTLDALANDLRFRDDEELRMTVATHPRVSMSTAERVTLDFKVPQLKKLLARPGLNQLLREKLFRRSTAR
jgi:hypothetical protein